MEVAKQFGLSIRQNTRFADVGTETVRSSDYIIMEQTTCERLLVTGIFICMTAPHFLSGYASAI
jgi:hypothetical protein